MEDGLERARQWQGGWLLSTLLGRTRSNTATQLVREGGARGEILQKGGVPSSLPRQTDRPSEVL